MRNYVYLELTRTQKRGGQDFWSIISVLEATEVISFLNLPVPIPDKEQKCLNKTLSAIIKPFEASQKSVKIKT